MPCARPLLLVEDNPTDLTTLKQIIEDLGITDRVLYAPSAERAFACLRCTTAEKPAVILLDLNQWDMAGIEFLRTVKSDPALREIPVVVLSESQERENIVKSFDLNVAGYVVKPADYRAFAEAIRIIQDYWSLNYLPAIHN